ncbi:MAG: hypothetical protein ACTMIR_03035 [Cellulomonadaceae bacterium]
MPLSHRNNQDDVQQFARDLRQLRFDNGTPTYESLARATGLSRSIIATAFGGRRLPSERTVHGIVAALDGDPTAWLERRVRVEAATRQGPDGHEAPADLADRDATASAAIAVDADSESADDADITRTVPLRTAILVGASAAVAALVLGTMLGTSLRPEPAVAESSGRGSVAPATGENIFDTRCVDDGIVIASETRELETQFQVLLSYECNAVWSRVLRYDGAAYSNEISVRIYPKGDPDSPDAQTAVVQDAATAITTMIVQESVTDEFCATAWLTVEDGTVDLGDPICV